MTVKNAIKITNMINPVFNYDKAIDAIKGGNSFGLDDCLKRSYHTAREAWLKGDLETVAKYFGRYI